MEVLMVTVECEQSGRRQLIGQLLRFATVGVLGAVVDFTVYHGLLHLGLSTYAARTLSFTCGTATAYVLNRRWAFRVEGGPRRVIGFSILYVITFLVIIAVNAASLTLLPNRWWTVSLAWALSQGVGTTCNFVMLRMVVFRTRQ